MIEWFFPSNGSNRLPGGGVQPSAVCLVNPDRTALRRGVAVYTDGAIRPEANASGLAVVAWGNGGSISAAWVARAGRMTCNEAEYAAVNLALEVLAVYRPRRVVLYSDSRVVIDQASGRARANVPALRLALFRLRRLASAYPHLHFEHIGREENRLADALACEAVDQASINRLRRMA